MRLESRQEWWIIDQTIHPVASPRYIQHGSAYGYPDREYDEDRGNADTGEKNTNSSHDLVHYRAIR